MSISHRGFHYDLRKNTKNYAAIHWWVRKNKPKSEVCEKCGKKKDYTLEVANISGNYKRDINDYLYLCRRCHMIQDGRIK